MVKKWFSRTTPFVIIAVITTVIVVFALFTNSAAKYWQFPLLLKAIVFVAAIVVFDVFLKFYFTKTYPIWIIEMVGCLGLFYYWLVT